MAGFEFGNHTVTVSIESKDYQVSVGDAEMADRVQGVYTTLQAIGGDTLAANPDANMTMSRALRDLIGALLGSDAQDAIFEGRRNNLLDEIELLTYIWGEVSAADEAQLDVESVMQAVNSLGIEPAAVAAAEPATAEEA